MAEIARRPEGYVGTNHEVKGRVLLSILDVLKFPEQVLGKEEAMKLASAAPDDWYPATWHLSLLETIDKRVGHYGLISLGRKLFQRFHEENAKKKLKSARDVLYAFDGLYHQANRGDAIGGWHVETFDSGLAEISKNTPHHCGMEQGILFAALEMVGVNPTLSQSQCFRQGASRCTFNVSSVVVDKSRWG